LRNKFFQNVRSREAVHHGHGMERSSTIMSGLNSWTFAMASSPFAALLHAHPPCANSGRNVVRITGLSSTKRIRFTYARFQNEGITFRWYVRSLHCAILGTPYATVRRWTQISRSTEDPRERRVDSIVSSSIPSPADWRRFLAKSDSVFAAQGATVPYGLSLTNATERIIPEIEGNPVRNNLLLDLPLPNAIRFFLG
jgi:hypothetical protein